MYEGHGLVKVEETELADGMVKRLVSELQAAGGEDRREELLGCRPVLRFVIERVIDAINRPVPVYLEPG
jgi:hypothetical protein